jgi:Tol biopolymer transport system component
MAQPFDGERGLITGAAVSVTAQEIETDPAFGRAGFASAATGELAFQSAADLGSRLVWFDANGKMIGRINETGLNDPRLSPDSQRVAVSSDDAHNGSRFIRVYDLKRGVSTRLTDSGQEEFPLWSPDGKSVLYLGRPQEGDASIGRVAADGSKPPVTVLKGPFLANDWHDGWIVYMNFEKGFPSLWAYNLGSHERRQLGEGSEAQFSPDGKWIAFAAGISGQGGQVYVEAFPGPGPRIQISSQGGGQPQWSRDGHQLFYIQADRKLMMVNLELRNGEINASAPRLVFQTRITAPHIALFQYAVAGDGRFLINSLPTESPSALTLLTNAISTK